MAIAKATCTCATCGQQFEVRVVKYNSREARSFEKWAEENITECRDCENKRTAARHEAENAKAAEESKEAGWPALTGTEKQIAWAESCRANLIGLIAARYDKDDDDLAQYVKETITAILLTQTSAAWWIDHRNTDSRELHYIARSMDGAKFDEMTAAVKAGKVPEKKAEEPKGPEQKEEPKPERPTAMPEDIKHTGCVDIRIENGKVTVVYDRDETFRQIVKRMGFTWNSCWSLKADETTGTAENVCAELGSRLLNAGFSVRFDTPEIMSAAVSGDYTPRHLRWIWKPKTGGFYIEWGERSDRLYHEAISIPGAKYSAPGVLVPDRSWDALADFAEKNDFRFTSKALEQMQSLSCAARVVAPASVKKPEYNEKNVLQTSREVLDDLRDET